MKLSKISLVAAAAALAAAPALAQVAFVPAIAPLNGEESEMTEAAAILIGVGVAAGVVAAVVLASEGEDEPVSF